MFSKPPMADMFGPELKRNLIFRFGSLDKVTQQNAINEGYGYALDMCFKYHETPKGMLTNEWVYHIASEVYIALCKYVLPIDVLNRGVFVVNVAEIMKNYSVATQARKYFCDNLTNPNLDLSIYINK